MPPRALVFPRATPSRPGTAEVDTNTGLVHVACKKKAALAGGGDRRDIVVLAAADALDSYDTRVRITGQGRATGAGSATAEVEGPDVCELLIIGFGVGLMQLFGTLQ